MFTEIMVVAGLFWSAAYVLIIRRGFKDHTFGMPVAALCANISWEAIFAFFTPHDPPQLYVNYVWFSLDAVIVFQFLKYARAEFPSMPRWQVYSIFAFGVAVAAPMILSINYEMDDQNGAYAAFGQNLMMSILFVNLLITRKGVAGQSFYIAVLKLTGTGLASLAYYMYRPMAQESVLLPFLFVAILVFDIIYAVGIYKKCKGYDKPLKRF